MAAYRTSAGPNLWFAGVVSETPSEARLRRGQEYLELRQGKREAHERTWHPASGMPGGGVAQRHSSRRTEEAAARVVVVGGGGGGGGGGGELADPAAAARERAEAARARHDEAAVATVPPPPPDPEAHVLLTGAQLAWLGQQLLRYASTLAEAHWLPPRSSAPPQPLHRPSTTPAALPHSASSHRTAPHRAAPRRAAPHRTAPHRAAPRRTARSAPLYTLHTAQHSPRYWRPCRLPPTQRDALRRRLPCGMMEDGWRCVPLALLDATGVGLLP
jgi:hypothetical protein